MAPTKPKKSKSISPKAVNQKNDGKCDKKQEVGAEKEVFEDLKNNTIVPPHKTAFREISMLDESPYRLRSTSEEIPKLKKMLTERFGEEISSVKVLKFSEPKLWNEYCGNRVKWTSKFGMNDPENSEMELIAGASADQEAFDETCKDQGTFNETFKLKDHLSKRDLTESVCINDKNYYMIMVFLTFIPYSKKNGSSYLITEPYAAYPLYSVFIPV